MADYLIFQLAAALGAMGELAGHERRGSLTWPGRSALTGLMAAALGIRRDGDFAALDALSLAVAVFDGGRPLRDYHTVETVPTAAARRPQARPAALAEAGRQATNTTITLRDYRTGPLFGVAVWGGALEPIRDALLHPVFTLYLGRKSCPLAAPLAPRIVAAETPDAALSHLRLPPWRAGERAVFMASDGVAGASRRERRDDIATDRRLWHFAPRDVALVAVEIAPEAAE